MHGYFSLFNLVFINITYRYKLFQPGKLQHQTNKIVFIYRTLTIFISVIADTIITRLDLRRAPLLLQHKALFAYAYHALPVKRRLADLVKVEFADDFFSVRYLIFNVPPQKKVAWCYVLTQ